MSDDCKGGGLPGLDYMTALACNHPTDPCTCTECCLRRALERSMAEVERLRDPAAWGTSEPIGPKFDAIQRLTDERDQARAELAAAQKVVEAAKAWREKYYEPCYACDLDDPEEGCTCGMPTSTLGEVLDAILCGKGPT